MIVVCTVVAALWLTAVTSTETECPPDRCCPSRFTVDPKPQNYRFRCEVANLTDGCDNLTMTEFVANTAIDAFGDTVCSGKTFVMTDWNWLYLEPFQPNVACAYYLPPVEGCCWALWLVKDFDPIVCENNCQCDCEDNVWFKEDTSNEKTYCDSDGGAPQAGWCWAPVGPHNVYGTVPFFTDVNKGVLTTFRSDNINGVGTGALVFAYALPCRWRSSVGQLQTKSVWSPSLKCTDKCWKKFFLCNNQACKMSRACYNCIKIAKYITRTLFAIFTDSRKIATRRNVRSPYEVLRRAARHALGNLKKFGKPVPTITQLRAQKKLKS